MYRDVLSIGCQHHVYYLENLVFFFHFWNFFLNVGQIMCVKYRVSFLHLIEKENITEFCSFHVTVPPHLYIVKKNKCFMDMLYIKKNEYSLCC